MEEKVSITTKRKQIQPAIEYCMDNRISFTISPIGLSPEEFQMDLIVSGIKQALALGMFVKEHKFELLGQSELPKAKVSTASVKKTEVKGNMDVSNASSKSEQQPVTTVLHF